MSTVLTRDNEPLRQLLDTTLDGYLLMDMAGAIVDVNPAYCRMVGYTRRELLRMTIFDLEAALTPSQIEEKIAHMIVVGSARFRTKHRHKGGAFLDLEVSVTLLNKGRSSPLIAAFVRDITPFIRTQEALRAQAARLRALHEMDKAILLALSPQAVAEAALSHVLRLIPCARGSIVLLDEPRTQVSVLALRTSYPTHVGHVGFFPLDLLRISETLRRGEPYVLPDIRQIPPQRLSDITRRLRDEGICSILNVPLMMDGRLVGLLNLGAMEPRFFSPRDVEIARELAVPLAIALKQAQMREELQHYAERLESLVDERTRSLAEMNEELKAFTYSVSHDLRAPLRAILGFAYALLDDYGEILDSAMREDVNQIINAAEDMQQLITDLLLYSRLVHGEFPMSAVDLDRMMTDMLDMLAGELEARQAHVAVHSPLGQVWGNERLLEQVIQNLLTNAIKFMPPGRRPQVHIWSELREGTLQLWVEDNGIGIPEEAQERIFRMFERLHGVETYPGTGVGLAIIRRGVERMGGRVGVESVVGKGSRFWIELKSVQEERSLP